MRVTWKPRGIARQRRLLGVEVRDVVGAAEFEPAEAHGFEATHAEN